MVASAGVNGEINVDAVVFPNELVAKLGVVARNHIGDVLCV